MRLLRGEHADKYSENWWVLTGPGYSFGIRTGLARPEGMAARVTIVGFPPGERRHVREYPGDRWWGWGYAFPLPDGITLSIASDHFAGTDADNAMLRRVLVGAARDRLCLPSR